MSAVIPRPSPNHDVRAPSTRVEILLLHYTGMRSAEEALARLTNPAAKVSAHYTIDEDGTVYAHVAEDRRAWHAGVSSWAGHDDVNSRSVGIEIVNPGHDYGYRAFPEAQIARLIPLAREIMARHAIGPAGVLGHSDVAPLRKQDPGELFPWRRLASAGIGVWPAPRAGAAVCDTSSTAAIHSLQTTLARVGYGLEATGRYDEPTRLVVAAFQRHFRPAAVTGEADSETVGLIESLASAAAS